jgi:hypothetical protein
MLDLSRSSRLQIAESRINLIRVFAIALLYAQHTISYFVFDDMSLSDSFHQGVNGAVLGGCVLVATVYLMLSQARWPAWMSFATVMCDGALITWLIILAGGPNKIQTVLLPVFIALSSLRPLKWAVFWSTGIAVLSYGLVLTHFIFVDVGYEAYYAPGQISRISRHDELFFLLALLIAGGIAHQVVRQTDCMAESAGSNANHDSVVAPIEPMENRTGNPTVNPIGEAASDV